MQDLVGKRIRLLAMPDDPRPIEPGSTGTVRRVQESPFNRGHWIVDIKWGSSRTLSMLVPPDTFEVINVEEEAAKDRIAA